MSSNKTEDKLTYWFVFQKNHFLLMKQEELITPVTDTSIAKLNLDFIRQFQIGTFNDYECYCAEIDDSVVLPASILLVPLRKAFVLLGENWYLATAKASSIIHWDKTHQFCGRCSSKTILKEGMFERNCESCGLTFYPRISPSMIVLINKGELVLMARGHHFPPGSYGLIAGFVEAGESIEDAVHREVREEVGIEIKNLHYFGSQAWPFPDALMIGFTAEYSSGEIRVDNKEVEEAGWYHFENLPGRPSSISIAGKLIDHFILEHKKNLGAK